MDEIALNFLYLFRVLTNKFFTFCAPENVFFFIVALANNLIRWIIMCIIMYIHCESGQSEHSVFLIFGLRILQNVPGG